MGIPLVQDAEDVRRDCFMDERRSQQYWNVSLSDLSHDEDGEYNNTEAGGKKSRLPRCNDLSEIIPCHG